MDFTENIQRKWGEKKFICINLDPDLEKIPESLKNESAEVSIVSFNKGIVDATADLACAYKPNSAFYEAQGEEGMRALRRTVSYIHETYPDVPIILDAKRADIGNSNELYAKAVFDEMGVDALTVHPYLGGEALEPFLSRKDKGIFVLVKTSNSGSGELQDLDVGGKKLYEYIASSVADSWNKNGNCGVVVGATYPDEVARVRTLVKDLPILIPGIGLQGGDAREAYANGKNSHGEGVLIAVGRSILYKSREKDFAEQARQEVLSISEEIRLSR